MKNKKTLARRIGDRIGMFINWVFYDMRYKKVYLEVRECENKSTHDEHVWSNQGGYIPIQRSYVCEG